MKYKITHRETGLFVVWEEENLEVIKQILQRGHRKVTGVRGNIGYPLTLENTLVEEIEV